MEVIDAIPPEKEQYFREYLFSTDSIFDLFQERLDKILANEKTRKILSDRVKKFLASNHIENPEHNKTDVSKHEDFNIEDIGEEEMGQILKGIVKEELAGDNSQLFEELPLEKVKGSSDAIKDYLSTRTKKRNWPDLDTRRQIMNKFKRLRITKVNLKSNRSGFLKMFFSYVSSESDDVTAGLYYPMMHLVVVPDEVPLDINTMDKGETADENAMQIFNQIKSLRKRINDKLAEKGISKTLVHEFFHSIGFNNFWQETADDTPIYTGRRGGIKTMRADGGKALEPLNEAVTELMTILTITQKLKNDMPFVEVKGKKYSLQKFFLFMDFTYRFEKKVLLEIVKKVPFRYFREAYFQKEKFTSLNRKIREEFGLTLQDIDNCMREDTEAPNFLSKGYPRTLKVLREEASSGTQESTDVKQVVD